MNWEGLFFKGVQIGFRCLLRQARAITTLRRGVTGSHGPPCPAVSGTSQPPPPAILFLF